MVGGVQHATQLGRRERRVQRNVILEDIAEGAAGGGMGGVVAPDARVHLFMVRVRVRVKLTLTLILTLTRHLPLRQHAREGAVRPCRAQLARKVRR